MDHQPDIAILKILAYYQMFGEMFFFSLVKIFVSFVKLLNISLEEYSLFLSHVR